MGRLPALAPALLAAGLLAACSACATDGGLSGERLYRLPLLGRPGASLTPAVRSLGRPGGGVDVPERTADMTDRALSRASGGKIASTAAGLVGSRAGSDCVGFVAEVFRKHGVELLAEGGAPDDNGVRVIWRLAKRRGAVHKRERPDPGDLVFFDDTHDRNADGRRNDPLTHVGIVERVDGDTVTFVHRVDRGVVRTRMNLDSPAARKVGGAIANDHLRVGSATGHAPRLAGSLFAGFATLAAD